MLFFVKPSLRRSWRTSPAPPSWSPPWPRPSLLRPRPRPPPWRAWRRSWPAAAVASSAPRPSRSTRFVRMNLIGREFLSSLLIGAFSCFCFCRSRWVWLVHILCKRAPDWPTSWIAFYRCLGLSQYLSTFSLNRSSTHVRFILSIFCELAPEWSSLQIPSRGPYWQFWLWLFHNLEGHFSLWLWLQV